ncbi:SagB/ThcOx family dehydrogenase [Salinigranum marinum]|uniref:SagB/ThcOx family dehydrogenase n=1 Tax=Salinigranum marinum TaxID=1515595 RepID=UPI002989A452|nr:SagB/ThcOx family dehydrogenase [Salinigranum marinum]
MTLGNPSRRTVATVVAAVLLSAVINVAVGAVRLVRTDGGGGWQASGSVPLPSPDLTGDVSVEDAIANRRSRREYDDRALDRRELGQLLWATQGVTDRVAGYRAAPSAGARYPLEVYVVVGTPGVEGLERGVYRYRPPMHELVRGRTGDVQRELRAASVDQEFVEAAAVDVVICAADQRTTAKYGPRGERRYVPMEAGHAGQNLYLQAETLGLATVSVGAFDDERVRGIIGAPVGQRPLYVFPVGARA